MQNKICSPGTRWRYVNQAKRPSSPLEQKMNRKIHSEIIVPQHRKNGASEILHALERGQITKIAEVPNLMRRLQRRPRALRKTPVRIGDDGDVQRSRFLAIHVFSIPAKMRI